MTAQEVRASDKYDTRQHWVSQHILGQFARTESGCLLAMRKQDGAFFTPSTANAACARGHFDYPSSLADRVTADSSFSRFEAAGNAVLDRIREARSLQVVSAKDRRALARWIGALFTAGASEKKSYLAIHAQIVRRASERGMDTFGINESNEHAQACFAALVESSPWHIEPYLHGRRWVLRTPRGQYVIGDNPVARINLREAALNAPIGIGSEAVELTFPIAPDLLLHMYCPLEREAGDCVHLLRVPASDVDDVIRDTEEETELLNFLQLNWAERHVFSADEEVLSRVRRWLDVIPGVSEPPRYRFSDGALVA